MSRVKFKVIDSQTEEQCKIDKGEMIVMNSSGVFFIVNDMQGYYTNIQKLSDKFPKYSVVWL